MRRPALFVSAFFCAFTLLGADFTGIWVGQVAGRNGEMQDVAIKFSQNGTKLTGKLYGDYQSTPIADGKVSGDEVSFIVIAPEQNGNQINEAKLRFTGAIKDGVVELTREREGATNAGNGGNVQFKGNAKQTFSLKRLF